METSVTKQVEDRVKVKHELIEDVLMELVDVVERLESFSDKVAGTPLEATCRPKPDITTQSLTVVLTKVPSILSSLIDRINDKIDCLKRNLY